MSVLLAISVIPSVALPFQAETAPAEVRLVCRILETPNGFEDYQRWRKSVGGGSEDFSPKWGTWEIELPSFSPPDGDAKSGEVPIAIRQDGGGVQNGSAKVRSWRARDDRAFYFWMTLQGGEKLPFQYLSIGDGGKASDPYEVSGYRLFSSPHLPSYSIKFSGSCQLKLGQKA